MRFGLPEEAILEIQAILALYPAVDKAILYGSRAMGNFKPGSDIDLTLVGAELTHNHLLGIMSDLDDLLLPWMIDSPSSTPSTMPACGSISNEWDRRCTNADRRHR
jgi:predicted nucleotidyltransferase